MLTVACPFPREGSYLRFLEPPGTCVDSLWVRLFARTYNKPFILDSGPCRSLHFDLDCMQSAMDLEDPDELTLPYTRQMMAFLPFNPVPRRILLLGLGGGSLAKFCHRHLPAATVTAVELDRDVISLREEFQIPRDNGRFRVVHGDGAEYVANVALRKDVILADACDRAGIAQQLNTLAFYRNARRCLAPGGVLVTNVCGDPHARAAHLLRLRQIFGHDLLTLQVGAEGNVIVIARNEPASTPDWGRLQASAGALQQRFGLEFAQYLRRIEFAGQ